MDNLIKKAFLREVATYYSKKIDTYGPTHCGVDWNSKESQLIRFDQLAKIIDTSLKDFSINDLGCGYGAFYDYLANCYSSFKYYGIDISESMISEAKQRSLENAQFIVSHTSEQIADYSIACGIFNVRLNSSTAEWASHIFKTLDILNQKSRLGFAANFLTSYSDADKMKDYLYYADPCVLFDHCKRHYSRNVSLLHDYELYEFTLLVKKT